MKRNLAFENYLSKGVFTSEEYNAYIEEQQRKEREEASKNKGGK